MEEQDFSKYENRLQTFNNFPRAIPVYIKDLVEAGFSFTGNGSLVFCFACGFTYNEWQDGDDPVSVHTNGSKHCPYLLGRGSNEQWSQIIQNTNGDKVRYFWDQVNKCLIRQDSCSSIAIQVDLSNRLQAVDVKNRPELSTDEKVANSGESPGKKTESRSARFAPIEKKSGYENLPGALMMAEEKAKESSYLKSPDPLPGKEVVDAMRNNENRLRSFLTHFPLLSRPQVHSLAGAGFYFPGSGDLIRCFLCNLTVADWQTFDNPIDVHIAKSPKCAFARTLVRRSQRLASTPSEQKDMEASFGQPSNKTESISHEQLPSFNCPGPVPRHAFVTDDSGNQVLPKITMPSPGEVSRLQTRHSPNQQGVNSSPSNYSPSHIDPRQGVTGRMVQGSPLSYRSQPSTPDRQRSTSASSVPSIFRGIDMSQRDRRLQTFSTWPQESPMEPFELAVAGFYYTGYRDGVRCYSCNIALKDWNQEDTPWGEHIRWAPNCLLVKDYLERNPAPGNTRSIRSGGSAGNVRGQVANTLCQPTVVSPEQNRFSMTEYSRQEQHSPESGTQVAFRYQPDGVASSSGATSPPNVLWPSLVDGICIKNIEVLKNLCDMGYTCKLIKEVMDLYATAYGFYFTNPDELVEAILCFQQDGNLQAFAKETYNVPSKEKCITPNPPSSPSSGPRQGFGPSNTNDNTRSPTDIDDKVILQQELEKAREAHLCKICMDATISVVFLPCGHLISCQSCGDGLKDCPMCRVAIQHSVKTYLS